MSHFETTKSIWITWHEHRRTKSLAQCLSVPISCRDKKTLLNRHILGFFWALIVLFIKKPKIIFLQHSYFLLLACVMYKKIHLFSNIIIINDCHNKALKKTVRGVFNAPFRRLKIFGFSSCDLLIVTNKSLLCFAEKLNSSVAILRDPIPILNLSNNKHIDDNPYVLFINSFDIDEPIDFIFEASEAICQNLDLDVVISGNYNKVVVPNNILNNSRIHLPGFMPENEYLSRLKKSLVTVVLTNDEDCLVCGAYEAISANRPLLLSDTSALRTCFGNYAFFSVHDEKILIRTLSKAIKESNSKCLYNSGKLIANEFEIEKSLVMTLIEKLI